jgi:signal transduction histidine kinase
MQVFTSVLVLSIVFAVFLYTDINSYKKRKTENMISLAQVIGTNSISAIQFQDSEAATEMLAELHNVAPEIIHAGITNMHKEIFASYSKSGADTFEIPEILKGNTHAYTDNQLFVSNPIIANNEVIGKVYLEVELSELQKITHYNLELAAVLLLVALVFSFLIAILIQSYISKRLLRLVNTMKNVSKTGEYEKELKDDGKDEIATLIKVFNNLMQQIKLNIQRKDEFIGIASHELKTPLTSIKGYIDMLSLMEDTQPKKQYIQKAHDNVNKLERLVKDLLDVSKIQSGQLQLEMQKFDLGALMDETIAAVQMTTGTHTIKMKHHAENLIVCADRQKIEQVLVNLLSNAIKYSHGEKEVIVDFATTEKEVTIKVRDFGTGVEEDELPKIFDRFYRAKNTSIHISGFGLGLYICRDIINRHYGKIWVEKADKGSVFNFSLPLKQSFVTQQTQA